MYKTQLSPYANIFYTEWLLEPTSSRYNLSIDQTLYGKLDVQALKRALKKYIAENVILNSHIQDIDGKAHWVPNNSINELEYIASPVSIHELSNYVSRSFDLHHEPLYRFKLICLKEGVYRFIVVMHHLIMDGSASLDPGVFEEIANYYNNENHTAKYSISKQIKLITDLTDSLSSKLEQNKQAHQEFWQKHLSDVDNVDLRFLKLGSDYHEKNTLETNKPIGEIEFSYDEAEIAKLNQIKLKYGATSYVYGLSIFALLLHKYTGQERIAISYPVAIKEGLDFIYGAQINTNLIPCQFDKSTTIANLFNQIREFFKVTIHSDIKHGYYQITDIIHDGGNKKLLDASFIQTYFRENPFKFNGITKVELNTELSVDGVTKDLLLFEQDARNSKTRLNYRVRYDTRTINKELLENFVSTYKRLFLEILEDLVTKNDSKPLANYSLLDQEQYNKIVYEWNKTEKDYPRDKTVHQLFEEQVARTPNNIAVVYEDTKLTYQELNQKANQLAHDLINNYKIKPDDLIALCLDRSEQMLIAILGVLKSGGAYVPIDPGYPDERIRYILNDTKAKVIIINDVYINRMLQLTKQKAETKNIDAIVIDSAEAQVRLVMQESINPIAATKNTNLIYVIYTSGTTGKPKGVMVEHKNMVNFITHVVQILETQDVTMSYINYSFDAINAEIYPALLNGNLLHILNQESRNNLEDLYKYIIKNNITFIVLPAVVATELSLNYNLNITKLRVIVVGGDIYRGKLGQIKIINQYGPTECTVCATIYQYQKGDAYAVIGKPISNATCYALDDNLVVLPTGAIGELFISGDGLAKGYLNSIKVTKEKFISNPFQTKEEKLQNRNNRLYRTGDLVRWLPNGNLEFMGRNDEQVKIRGFRVELGEIENKLLSYPGIKQAVVVVQEKSNNKYLLAYYVADKKLDETKIHAYLSSKLPEYMLPQVLIYIDKLPLTANGKLDKKSLPEPELMNQSEYVAPRNELEKSICEIYAQVLHLPITQVGIKHDFFRMGGDSISSIQFVYRIRYKLPFNISVADVYAHRNAEQLAKNILIKQSTAKKTTNIKQETKPLGHADLLPIQEWFFENVKNGLYPKHHHWNQAFIIKTPELDLEILKLSIIKLLEHHDAFRLRYKNSQQAYIEIDFSKELDSIQKIDVSALQAAELKRKLIETQSSFNIETGPVHAIAYLHGYRDKTARLFFALHHLIVDSVSWRILAHDIEKLYQLLQDKDNIHKTSQELLGPKGTSYRQWIEEIKNYQPNQIELTHWEDTLKDHISIFPKTNEQSYTDFSLPSQSTQQLLTKVNETYNTQINDILLSALARTLSQVFYRQVNHITLEGHGREGINEQIDITKTVGWFTTMYPVRLVDHDAIPDLIKATKENLRRIPNKGIGYGATKGYKKLPLINFNYLGQLHNTAEFWTIVDHIISIDPQNQSSNMLDMYGYVVSSTLKFHVSCNDSLPFDAKDFADKYKSNLEKLISHCIANHEVAEKNCKNLKYVQDGSMYKLLHQVKLSYASKTNENLVNKRLQSKIDCYLKNANSLSQDLFLKKPIANVLLTGSTGFLGCNLLNQLLKLTDYNVFLLVRADSQIAAVTRISKKFKFYFDETLDEFYEKRIFVLKSNITDNNLGLSEKEYKDLSLKIDSIIHAAALVKHYGDYDDFYLQNVQSTINLLELAKLTKSKDFHYVSTYSVLNNSRKPICTEEDISNEAEQDNVYLKTKSQGEYQVIKYRDCGIRSNIYRVGNLTFIAENLRTQENVEENGFLNWVNCIYKLRCVAKEVNSVKISPVDLTARAIVKLFDKNGLSNKTHHVFTPYPFNISESMSKIEMLSINKFIDKIIDEMKYGINDNLIMKFLLYQGWMGNSYAKNTKVVEVLQDRTQYILKHLDFTWTLDGIKAFFNKYYKLLDTCGVSQLQL